MSFEDCICFQLGRATRKISRQYRDQISGLGLTQGQFFMLVAILEEDGLAPSQLAVKTAQDRATITGLLDRLERDGWIQRRPAPGDRRSLRIHLSPKASERRESILAVFQETNDRFLRRFSPGEWKRFQAFLSRLD